jgi:hypothetical protein
MTSLGRRVRRNMLIGQTVHERAVIKVKFYVLLLEPFPHECRDSHKIGGIDTSTKAGTISSQHHLGFRTIEETYRK